MKYSFKEKKFFIRKNFTPKDIITVIQKHKMLKGHYKLLRDYYVGKHEILYRSFNDDTKPNNRVVNNFAKLIVDTGTSYFTGLPITYNCKNIAYLDALNDIQKKNYADDVISELDKMSDIYGHAFEFHYIRNGEEKFKPLSPDKIMVCYSDNINEDLLCAIVYDEYKDEVSNEIITNIEVYTDKEIWSFNAVDDEVKDLPIITPHRFPRVPVVEFIANEERLGAFETVITAIDAYNIAVSDAINEVEYWNDSYLLLRNLNATTQEDILEMKRNRVLMLDGDGEAEFLTKDVNDKHFENIKDRLTADIHKFAQTPNLQDEQFASNLSGVAIRYKMMGLEHKTAIKERKFNSALQERIELITHFLNLQGCGYDEPVDVIFTRNLPSNLVELADIVSKVRGVVSDETLRSTLPFIHDLEAEKLKVEKEKQSLLDYDMNYTDNSEEENNDNQE